MIYGLLLSFASFAAYSFSDACVKFIDGTLPAYETAFFGAVFGLIILPFMKGREDSYLDIFHSKNWSLWFLRNIAAAVAVIGSVTAFTHLSMAEAFCLIFLQPIFVSILSMVFLKEHVGWRRWGAILIGFIGVIIVLRPGFRELNIGHLGAVFAGLGSAISIIIFRVMGDSEKRITLYASGILGTILICGLLSIPSFSTPSNFQWLYLAGYGLLAALGAILTMAAARLVSASTLAAPQYSQMVWAILIGYFIFHEHLDVAMWIGIGLIMASSLLTFVREEKRNVSLPRPVSQPQAALAQLKAAHIQPKAYHTKNRTKRKTTRKTTKQSNKEQSLAKAAALKAMSAKEVITKAHAAKEAVTKTAMKAPKVAETIKNVETIKATKTVKAKANTASPSVIKTKTQVTKKPK